MKSFVLHFDDNPNFEAICNYLESKYSLALPLKPKTDSGINSLAVVLHDEYFSKLNNEELKKLMFEIAVFSHGQVRINTDGYFEDEFLAVPSY